MDKLEYLRMKAMMGDEDAQESLSHLYVIGFIIKAIVFVVVVFFLIGESIMKYFSGWFHPIG